MTDIDLNPDHDQQLLDAVKCATLTLADHMPDGRQFVFVMAVSYLDSDGAATDVRISSNMHPPMARDFMAHLAEAPTPRNFAGTVNRNH